VDLLFDKSGASTNGFSPVLFSPDGMDFTTEVIGELNKKSVSASPTAARSPTKP
jgi:hypothetical protein